MDQETLKLKEYIEKIVGHEKPYINIKMNPGMAFEAMILLKKKGLSFKATQELDGQIRVVSPL